MHNRCTRCIFALANIHRCCTVATVHHLYIIQGHSRYGIGCRVYYQHKPASASDNYWSMGDDSDKHSSKHKRNRDKDRQDGKKKKHKSDHESSKKRRRKEHDAVHITDDDPSDDMWIEKNIDLDGERVRTMQYRCSHFNTLTQCK